MKAFSMVCAALLVSCLQANAQDKAKTSPFPFSSVNQAGLIVGDEKIDWHVQTINGVQHKSWFAGLGVGIDNYYTRSVPVFVDVRKMVRPGKWPLFVYADGGVNMPWIKKADKEELWYDSKMKAGLYYDLGAGFEFPIKKSAFLISGGYSTKKLEEERTYAYIWGPPGMPENKDFLHYKFSRVVLKAGFRF